MFKKVFFVLSLFLFPLFALAQDSYHWTDIDRSCFAKKAEVDIKNSRDFLLKLVPEKDLFFVLNNKPLINKVFSEGREKFLDYKVLSITGIKGAMKNKATLLNDNNYSTKVNFDEHSSEEKIIDIELNKIILAGSFRFNISFSPGYRTEYYISKEGQSYTRVTNPENFDFKFLKVNFVNLNNNNKALSQILAVAELNFIQKGKKVYVVNNVSQGKLDIYADFKCEDTKVIQSMAQFLTRQVATTSFEIDSDTKTYDLNWRDNPGYNTDFDGDSILNNFDNCPFVANEDQKDIDKDLRGDACDLDNDNKNFFEKDTDGDKVADSLDNCPTIFNPKQKDGNADKKGDLCSDDDRDGIIGYKDNCINIANRDQADINVNGVGDACEFDKDLDGIFDSVDNCISIYNPNQRDSDRDYIGDDCDNCNLYNPRQIDKNNNKIGDVCEEQEKNIIQNDKDGDKIINSKDNCVDIANPKQEDEDKDGVGDVCDNCLGLQNPKQIDKNNNKIGDKCEDYDGDGIVGYLDNCEKYANPDQKDSDNDGVGDVCEDDDHDGVVASLDNCPFVYNKDQADIDKDGRGDRCDNKDNRFVESNKSLFIGFIILITFIFAVLIIVMLRKISREKKASNYDIDPDSVNDNQEQDG